MYMVAIKDAKAWQGYSAAELSMVGFWNLIIVWLKVRLIVMLLFLLFPYMCVFLLIKASPSMAILPIMGARRRDRPTRKHGALYGEQLFHIWVLEKLA
jgi:hypothetical protein